MKPLARAFAFLLLGIFVGFPAGCIVQRQYDETEALDAYSRLEREALAAENRCDLAGDGMLAILEAHVR